MAVDGAGHSEAALPICLTAGDIFCVRAGGRKVQIFYNDRPASGKPA